MGLTSAGTAYIGPGLVYSGAFSFAPLLVLEKTLTLSAALFTAQRPGCLLLQHHSPDPCQGNSWSLLPMSRHRVSLSIINNDPSHRDTENTPAPQIFKPTIPSLTQVKRLPWQAKPQTVTKTQTKPFEECVASHTRACNTSPFIMPGSSRGQPCLPAQPTCIFLIFSSSCAIPE